MTVLGKYSETKEENPKTAEETTELRIYLLSISGFHFSVEVFAFMGSYAA
jgi:hypothetical protein